MTLMSKFKLACAAAVLAFSALPAQASVINWTLNNVVFDDGGKATGTFAIDTTTGDVTAFNLKTTSGSTFSIFNYTLANSQFFGQNIFWPANSFLIVENGFTRYIQLSFANALTVAGIDPIIASDGNTQASYECNNCSTVRYITGGEAISAVPLPGALPLMVAGLAGIGFVGSRRRKSRF